MGKQGTRDLCTGKRKTAFIQKYRPCNSVWDNGCMTLWDLEEYVEVIKKMFLQSL